MNQSTIKEALAVTGLGLFVFGIWQIYPPAASIVSGMVLVTPFMLGIKRGEG